MQKFKFILLFLPFISSAQIQGTWHSSFTIAGTSHRADMKILDSTVLMSNPDSEKVKDVAMENVQLNDSIVSFSWTKINLMFQGKYYPEGDSIKGVMAQSGLQWEVSFYRDVQAKIVIARPQEPKEPFDYPVEEILIKNGDITLGATLTLPKNAQGEFPIVILASGSGPQDRNCEIMGHKPFLVIADYFAKNGIACLRFDDRGTGKSTGIYNKASLVDFSSDVRACVSYLSGQFRFAGHPIGIAGHSEGGMHALMAATKNKDVKFIIELASVGTSGKEVLVEQQYLIPKQAGESEEYCLWNKEVFDGMSSIVAKYSPEKAIEPLNEFLDEQYAKAPENYKALTNAITFKFGMQVFLNNQWGHEFVNFHSEDYLKKIKVPILAINGSRDIQVPPISNQKGFNEHFSKKSKTKSKALVVDGLNHLMQTCQKCYITEYGDLEESFSPDVMRIMSDWVKGL